MSHKVIRRKKPEEVPLENEARFRTFFERSADPMSLLYPQTLRYIEANEAVARLFGAPDREALRDVSPTERWPERQPDGWFSIEKASAMIKIALERGSHRFDWLVRRYDGTELPLDIEFAAPIQPGGERAEVLAAKHLTEALTHGSARFEWMGLRRDGNEVPMEVFLNRIQLGSQQLLQALCNDITVRKRAEAELRESEARLRESEERFRTAFRVSPLNITILRFSDAKFVEANDAFVRWPGIDRDRIIGHDSRELDIWLNLEDREKFLAELRRNGSVRDVEWQNRSG